MIFGLAGGLFPLLLCSLIAAKPQKRDTSSALETLVIPLALDKNQRYSVAVGMSPGPDQQSFNFALTTGTGYSVVASTGCSDCGNAQSYDTTKSQTVKQLPDLQNMTLLGTNASGGLIEENCQLTQSNGSAWAYPNQTLILANSSSSVFSGGISGVFGLGTNGRNGDFSATVFSGWLSRNPGQTNFTYGMMLNPPSQDSGANGGVLHWQSPNTASYEGDVAWKPVSDFNSTSLQSDWFVTMDGLSFSNNAGSTVSESGNLITAVDPYESAIVFPQSVAGSIYGGISGASLLPSLTTSTNKWSIPCDTKMSLTLNFGSLSVPVDETTLVSQTGSLCFGTIEEWVDPQANEYLLGSSFISLIYLIFSISGSSTGSVGFAKRKTSGQTLSGGAIAGIVLGSVAFTILVAIGLFLLYRKRQKRKISELARPFVSPPTSPGRDLEPVRHQPSMPNTPFDQDQFGFPISPNSQPQEVMVALPSSVYTQIHPNYSTPTTMTTTYPETPPPYQHARSPTRPLITQKSASTLA